MKKYTLLILLALLLPAAMSAQKKERTGIIVGQVKNALNHTVIDGARVTLMTLDSTVIAVDSTSKSKQSMDLNCVYWFNTPMDMPAYILKAEVDGYQPAYLNLEPKKVKGMGIRYVDALLLHRKPKTVELDEVVVKATKVKFYHNGDTLVYNADAFQLSEGSMLDALIRQLPGVELKDNGQIYVNGKYVESLLLNGEDFFKKNNQIMLDNLPAYMVQNVKVYERSSFMDQALAKTGRKKADLPMVMDVHLKRQYEIGWIGYIDAGGGTHDRWLSRAFLSRFTPHSRVSAFANLNNLNDSRRPGENTSWTPDALQTGDKTQRLAGIDYNIKEKDGVYKFAGDLTLAHNDENILTRTNTETYLAQQNSWTRAQSQQRNHRLRLTTQHTWDWRQNLMNSWEMETSLKYDKWRNRAGNLSAMFNVDPALSISSATDLLDSIAQPNAGNLLRRIAANRYIENSRINGHQLTASGRLELDHYFDESLTDDIDLQVQVSYDGKTNRNYNQYRLDYPASPQLATDYRNRYSLDRPNHTTNYQAYAKFMHWFNTIQYMIADYKIEVKRQHHDYSLYRLDQLAGYGTDDNAELGKLPSLNEYEQTQDLQNSFYRTQTDVTNTWSLAYCISRWHGDNKDIQLIAYLPFELTNRNMDYRQATFDGSLHRRTFFVNPYFQVLKMWNSQQWWVDFRYRLTQESSDLVRFVDVMNNENPLAITLGNPDLLNLRTHYFKLAYRMGNNYWQFQPLFEAWLYDNALAMGRVYNSQTGVTQFRPYSVDGNRKFKGGISVMAPLDKPRHLTFSNNIGATITRNVDLMSVVTDGNMNVEPQQSTVISQQFWEQMKLEYQFPKVNIALNGTANYYHTQSHRADFRNQHAWVYHYGPSVKADLPWGMKLATDLQVYSRRGFNDSAANTDDVVWNARLSKTIPKTSLTLLVDAMDILHQLSSHTVTMDYQGRTETYRNVLPNYVLFHLIYRLNKKPKKL